MRVRSCMRACVRACVRERVRACVRVYVRACGVTSHGDSMID